MHNDTITFFTKYILLSWYEKLIRRIKLLKHVIAITDAMLIKLFAQIM